MLENWFTVKLDIFPSDITKDIQTDGEGPTLIIGSFFILFNFQNKILKESLGILEEKPGFFNTRGLNGGILAIRRIEQAIRGTNGRRMAANITARNVMRGKGKADYADLVFAVKLFHFEVSSKQFHYLFSLVMVYSRNGTYHIKMWMSSIFYGGGKFLA